MPPRLPDFGAWHSRHDSMPRMFTGSLSLTMVRLFLISETACGWQSRQAMARWAVWSNLAWVIQTFGISVASTGAPFGEPPVGHVTAVMSWHLLQFMR